MSVVGRRAPGLKLEIEGRVHQRNMLLLGALPSVVTRSRLAPMMLGFALACTAPTTPSHESESSSSDSSDTTAAVDQDVPSFVPDETESTDTGTGPVDSHDEDIQPIWTYNCVIYCHGANPNGPAGDLTLETGLAYDALVGVPATEVDMLQVSPGSLEDSYLWHKLLGTHLDVGGSGVQMPMNGLPLDAETIGKIETWILLGAPP